jgi:ABC-type lipoprotein release transport system permease subunit
VRLIVRAAFRRRWRSWVALAALVAVIGGVTLGAVAAGQRTARAYPDFLRLHGFDWAVATQTPTDLARIPGVASAIEAPYLLNGVPSCRCSHPIDGNALSVVSVGSRTLGHLVNLVSGRMPNPSNPDEALASFTLQRDDGVNVGTVIRMPMYAPSQQQAVLNSTGLGPTPRGPTITLTVVGIEASVTEFPSGINPSGGSATYDLYTSQAFASRLLPEIAAYYTYFVDLHNPAAGSAKFKHTVNAMGVLNQTQLDTPSSLEAGAIHPQAMGWWLLALVGALAGIAVVGQALSRQVFVESEDNTTLAALGVTPRQLAAATLTATGAVAVAGALGSILLAYLVSPFAPAGVARAAEASTGLAFDTAVLVVGGVAVAGVVGVLAMWPAIRAAGGRRGASPPTRPSAIGARLNSAGAPPSVVIGVRHALERGSGSAASPVTTAILGTVLAVAALCGTGVFAASLSRLGSEPSLYGDDYQVIVYALHTSSTIAKIERTPGVEALSLGTSSRIEINHVFTTSFVTASLRGPVLLSVVEGSLPTQPDQIALGAATMHQAGVHVGSVVPVVVGQPQGGTRTVPLHVTGVVAFPTGVADDQAGLGDGADLSLSMFCPSSSSVERCSLVANSENSFAVLVRVVPGAPGRAAIARLEAAFPGYTATPAPPNGLVNFGEAVDFPLIFGVVLAVFGTATLVHLLVVSIARRRLEMGLLKSLGFVRHQVAAVVYWQTATVTVLGLVLGTTVGIAVGREVWIGFARNIGVVPAPVVDTGVTVLLLVGVGVTAALLAVAPAWAAARARASEVLRTQ